MRHMKEIREARGFTIQGLSDKTGVPTKYIREHELGLRNTSYMYLSRIARVLGRSIKELNEEIEEEVKKVNSNKCLNEACLLNSDKKCVNDLVLSGRAPCYGKDKIQSKGFNKVDYSGTQSLFL